MGYFATTIEMKPSYEIIKRIEKESEIHRKIYNTVLGECLKRHRKMKQTRRYKEVSALNQEVKKEIDKQSKIEKKLMKEAEETGKKYKESEDMKILKRKKKEVNQLYKELDEKFGLRRFDVYSLSKKPRDYFGLVTVKSASATAKRAFETFQKEKFGLSKKVNFIKEGTFYSFESGSNDQSWMYKKDNIVYRKRVINLKIPKKDIYLNETLSEIESRNVKVKYVRILKKVIRGKARYYAQLVIEGEPVPKRNRDGSFKFVMGKGRVGIDPGTSSIAIVSDNHVELISLAGLEEDYKKIRRIQRKMDRSKRAMNPGNYDEKGVIKKGRRTWVFSNNYLKDKQTLAELRRKAKEKRKLHHETIVNKIITLGDEFYVEKMNYKGLQKRAKETKVSEKTGRYIRKKRFGKTLSNTAPATFLSLLKETVEKHGGTYHEINTHTFKASQYDHKSEEYIKKPLGKRWHVFNDGERVQRDLYSAFLIKNSAENKKQTDQKLCEKTYEKFKELHDEYIEVMKEEEKYVPNSGISIK